MSTRGSIYYKHPLHIYEEMNDGWVYFTLEDHTPDILIPLCRIEFYYKIKRAIKAPSVRFANVVKCPICCEVDYCIHRDN